MSLTLKLRRLFISLFFTGALHKFISKENTGAVNILDSGDIIKNIFFTLHRDNISPRIKTYYLFDGSYADIKRPIYHILRTVLNLHKINILISQRIKNRSIFKSIIHQYLR